MEKIDKLKKLIIELKLDGYLVPKNDEFFGEYVPESKDNLKFISDFTGSSGFALILKKKNYLFVDGRYTLQAKNQSGKKFNIITIPKKFPRDIVKNKNLSIGFDPKLHTQVILSRLFKKSNCKLLPINENLINNLKKKEKLNKVNKFFLLKNKSVGQDSNSKVIKLLNILKKKGIDYQFVSASENIAWLLNIRGSDSKYSPIPNGYLILDRKKNISLFCDLRKIDNKFKKKLKHIKILNVKDIEHHLKKIKNKKILIDQNTCSIFFTNIIIKNNKLINRMDPIYNLKSIKNKTEIKNMIKAHIFDGVALTKFLFWIKKNYKKNKITEINAQDKLLQFRKINKDFKSLSFPSISGAGPNGAIIHYKANTKTNRILDKGDIYLIDSGGQYNFGTTDVTRTLSLGSNNRRIKNIFTRVLKGHIAVANYNLKKNTAGSEIDKVARKYLNEINLDYPHGTGHGVGCYLNVHEGPQAISKNNNVILKEGMILSNEPGYYEKNKFGVRIENLIRVKKIKNVNKFEDLTLVPIEKLLINEKLLSRTEINWLNSYHKKVYLNLKNFMNKVELKELAKSCSKI